MRPKHEVEIAQAESILTAMEQRIADLERWWPPSKRGSNAQRALDGIKEGRLAALQCLRDARS